MLRNPPAAGWSAASSTELNLTETRKPAKVKAIAKSKPAKSSAAPRKAAGPVKKTTKAKLASPKIAKAKAAPQLKTTKPAKAPRAKPARPPLLDLIVKVLDDAKAEDIVELNLIGKNPMTDYMIVASGRSQRHVAALAEQLAQKLKENGYGANIEGLGASDWVLVDALDAVVHLFRPEVRSFYNLEQMWADDAPVAQAS